MPFLEVRLRLLAFFVTELTPTHPIEETELVYALKLTKIGDDIEPLVTIARKTAEAGVYSSHFFHFLIYLPSQTDNDKHPDFQSKVFLAIFHQLNEDDIYGIYKNIDVGFSMNINVLKYCSKKLQITEMQSKMRESDCADLLAGLSPQEREPFWRIINEKSTPQWSLSTLVFLLLKYGMEISREVQVPHEDVLKMMFSNFKRLVTSTFMFGNSGAYPDEHKLNAVTKLEMVKLLMRHPVKGYITFDPSVVEAIREITPQDDRWKGRFIGTKFILGQGGTDYDKKRKKNLRYSTFTTTLHFQHKSLEEWRYEDVFGKPAAAELEEMNE